MSLLPTLAVLCLLAPPAVETPAVPPAVVAKADLKTLYKQLLPNTCWIIVEIPDDPDSIRMGTGWVYDGQRRLVITNEHVIRGMDECDVHFPREADGKIVVDPDEYLVRGTPIRAEVIDRDEVRDLALLQLRSLPKSATGVKLAADLPEPGERLLTIAGLPDGSKGLWVMTTGTVRLSYRRNIATGSVTGVVETDLPFNPGNSGGPVVNEVGELVAVVEGYEVEARAVSMTIDVGEVRAYVAECDPLIAPKTAQQFLERGRRRHNTGRWEYALSDYGEALRLDSTLTLARLNRGWIFATQEDYAAAQQEFETVLKQDPENVSAFEGRGVCRRETGDHTAAVSDFTQAIRRSPQDGSLYFRRANAYREQGELELALADMNRAIKYDPDTVDHWASRGQIYRQLKRYEEAAADISKAWKMEPNNFQWIYELAYVHMDYGNNDKAYTLYSMAAELNEDEPRIYNNRGLVLNRLERYEEALRDFSKAIELNPNKALYYEHAGDTLSYLQRYAAAVQLYTKSIELDPSVASAYRGRGDAYKALQDTKAAERDYRRAEKLEE